MHNYESLRCLNIWFYTEFFFEAIIRGASKLCHQGSDQSSHEELIDENQPENCPDTINLQENIYTRQTLEVSSLVIDYLLDMVVL